LVCTDIFATKKEDKEPVKDLDNTFNQSNKTYCLLPSATDVQKSILTKIANSRMSQIGRSKSVIGEERDEMSIIQM